MQNTKGSDVLHVKDTVTGLSEPDYKDSSNSDSANPDQIYRTHQSWVKLKQGLRLLFAQYFKLFTICS